MVGGAIDEHLLFIFATWSGLTGNKCVQEVNKAGECVKKSVSQVYVAVRRCCPELNSRGEWIVRDDTRGGLIFPIRSFSGGNEPCRHRVYCRKCISSLLCTINSPVMPPPPAPPFTTRPLPQCPSRAQRGSRVGEGVETEIWEEGWESRETTCIFDDLPLHRLKTLRHSCV